MRFLQPGPMGSRLKISVCGTVYYYSADAFLFRLPGKDLWEVLFMKYANEEERIAMIVSLNSIVANLVLSLSSWRQALLLSPQL